MMIHMKFKNVKVAHAHICETSNLNAIFKVAKGLAYVRFVATAIPVDQSNRVT
jgi:hypothetical protein